MKIIYNAPTPVYKTALGAHIDWLKVIVIQVQITLYTIQIQNHNIKVHWLLVSIKLQRKMTNQSNTISSNKFLVFFKK